MELKSPPVHVFNTHLEAEQAIRALAKSGFDMKKLSLIGKGYHTEEHPVGFYTMGDRIKSWGGTGAIWGGIWGLLFSPAVFLIPGVGLLAMAGPLVMTLIGALEGAVFVGGLSALGAALTQIGVPKDQAIHYNAALKVDKYLLVVHGNAEDASVVSSVLAEFDVLQAA